MTRRASATLSELLRSEMTRHGLDSTRDLAKALSNVGLGDLSQGTAHRLLNKPDERIPTDETLRKVARFLGLPITEVRRIAERPSGEPEHFTLPREFDQLNARERAVLCEMGWTLIAARAERITR